MRVPFDRSSKVRRLAMTAVPVLLVATLGGAVAGCSAQHDGGSGTPTPAMSPTAHASMTPGEAAGEVPTPDEVAAAWAMRPDYVAQSNQATQAAYAFAIARPDVIEWLPCYCGCGAMGHASNLDCFIKPTDGAPVVFEEHGSYCGVCVETALMAQDMLAKGATLIQMRAAVDMEFGDLAPGTPTDLPPG
ncbi:MAG TPA: PCYCGC motif-containing (lipo)protein [Candidatus Limnocylindrales bacterium]|nr:PCYCGC motif-containing (lipo)protein [Candidatus Limnocylindrales bacterium]